MVGVNMNDLNKTGVYCIRNTINGKRYIGSTSCSLRKRWENHKRTLRNNSHENVILQRAWNKYGENAFLFEVIKLTDRIEAVAYEQSYIDFYKSADRNFGYNICELAASPLGTKRSAESIEKMRKSATGRVMSAETRLKLSISSKKMPAESRARTTAANIGRVCTEKTREKISAAQRGKPRKSHSAEARQKISDALKGRVISDETRARISVSRKGIPCPLFVRSKISNTLKGIPTGPKSEETKAKLSLARKGKAVSEETRSKISNTLSGRKNGPLSEETKRNLSESKMGRKKLPDGKYTRIVEQVIDEIPEYDPIDEPLPVDFEPPF